MDIINLEKGYPTVAEALETVKNSIVRAKHTNTKAILFIHGYGSSGVGGKIRTKCRQYLNAEVENGNLAGVVIGEEFDMFNAKARKVHLIGNAFDEYYGNSNQGITICML